MLAVVLLLLCCCCVVLLGGGAAVAYWYFYHYLKEAPAPAPIITTPPPIPQTITAPPPTPSITPTPPTPKTGGTPPKPPTPPKPQGPLETMNLTDDPKLEYTSGTFMQLASIIDPQAVADMNNIRWYDHTPPLVRYDMVKDAGKIVGIVITDDYSDTLRWLPEGVRKILDAIVFLYRNLKRPEDKAEWTTDDKKSLLGGYWSNQGRWPYIVCAIRKPNHDTKASGAAGQDIVLNASMDPKDPYVIQTFFHEAGHVLTGTLIRRHKNWVDGMPGGDCPGFPEHKEPLCSYVDNLAKNIDAFKNSKLYTCNSYLYECRTEKPLEYLAAVFHTYFCENSPQQTVDPHGWEWMNSMFHQKTFRGLPC